MDAIVTYSKANDIELLYDHYQENFYKFLDDNYEFRFPFDLEVATDYFNKTVLSKGDNPREYFIEGNNQAIYKVLDRAIKNGKSIEFLDEGVSLESIRKSIDNNYSLIQQYVKSKGQASFNRDFSPKDTTYKIKFVD